MNFELFLKSPVRNCWIYEPGIEIYVRRSIRTGVDIDLANMNADAPGNGSLTAFLNKHEAQHVFCVENIHNLRLREYLHRRDYTRLDNGLDFNMVSPNYVKPPEVQKDTP